MLLALVSTINNHQRNFYLMLVRSQNLGCEVNILFAFFPLPLGSGTHLRGGQGAI